MSYKGVECQSLDDELPLKMDLNYKGYDFETGMDMYLFVLENYDLLTRSLEYAEKFLLSYEFNICEYCLSNYDLEDCCFCKNDFKIIFPFTEDIKKHYAWEPTKVLGFIPICYTRGRFIW